MRRILAFCLVLVAGCGSTELTREGMQVRAINEAPSGCQIVGTIRDAEGGGLRSFESNRAIVESRLRNEAARIGGNALSVVSEERGDTEEGKENFTTGVPGLTSPAAHCTNCVLVTARVFSCGAGAQTPVAVQPPAPPPQQHPECEPKPVAAPQPPVVPAAPPPAAPAAVPPTYVAPGAATVIIVLPPPPMAPPPPQVVPQVAPQDDYHR